MFFIGPKIIYHQFTGKFTKVPDPRGAVNAETGQIRPPVDDQPIFRSYPGFISGPFEVIKPPVMEQQPDRTYKPKPGSGEIRYFPAILEITWPQGGRWRHAVKEAWHIEVNYGTEWMQHWGRVENALQKKDVSEICSYFEYVTVTDEVLKEPRALVGKK